MDWDYAISRHRDTLLRIAASLFALLGIETWITGERVPRRAHRIAMRLITPVEAAARRLIVIVARDMTASSGVSRPMPRGCARPKGPRRPVFRLFEQVPGFPRAAPCQNPPRIWSLETYDKVFPAQVPAPPLDDGLIDGTRLSRRLHALKSALEDLPREARRLIRLKARREEIPSLKGLPALRPGLPPGYQPKHTREIDEVLRDCHWLAHEVERAVPS